MHSHAHACVRMHKAHVHRSKACVCICVSAYACPRVFVTFIILKYSTHKRVIFSMKTFLKSN